MTIVRKVRCDGPGCNVEEPLVPDILGALKPPRGWHRLDDPPLSEDYPGSLHHFHSWPCIAKHAEAKASAP